MERMGRRTVLIAGASMLALAGCGESSGSQAQTTTDGRFNGYHMWFTKDGATRWAMLVTDNLAGGQVVVNFAGETFTLARQLVENIMSPATLAALVAGVAGVRIAEKGRCGRNGCGGTIIYNDGAAYSASQSGSNSSSTAGATASVSSRGTNPFVLGERLGTRELRDLVMALPNASQRVQRAAAKRGVSERELFRQAYWAGREVHKMYQTIR